MDKKEIFKKTHTGTNMNKLKLLYSTLSVTVIILLAFIGYSVTHQATSSPEELGTLTSQALIELENFSIVRLRISNREGRDINYTICTSVDNSTRCFEQPIRNGKSFTYGNQIHLKKNEEREVTIVVYKEVEPIENITYNFGKFDVNSLG